MKKRKFLLPLAAVTASFSAEQAVASVGDVVPSPENNQALSSIADKDTEKMVMKQNDQVFNFTLKQDGSGKKLAWHESHASHASHASHSSHTSSHY